MKVSAQGLESSYFFGSLESLVDIVANYFRSWSMVSYLEGDLGWEWSLRDYFVGYFNWGYLI